MAATSVHLTLLQQKKLQWAKEREELRHLEGIWTTLGRGDKNRLAKCFRQTDQRYSSTTTLELSGCGRGELWTDEELAAGGGEKVQHHNHGHNSLYHNTHTPHRKRTPSLPPIIPNNYEEFEASGETSGYASDSAGNEYLPPTHHHQHHHCHTNHRHSQGWIKQPLLPNQVNPPWTTSSSLSAYSNSCCGAPATPDSVSTCSWGGGELPRAKWGDRGVGVGHLWTATPHLPHANLPLPPESSRLSGSHHLNPPAWIHRNSTRDGEAEVLVISHKRDDEVHLQDAMPATHSRNTLLNSPDHLQRTYIRGQNVHLEPDELADRERKRQRALDHQRAIKQQVEEKERKRREEQERQEREERAAEERLRRQQELERKRIDEERRRQREKEEKEERIARAMREALAIAERAAKEEKARARMRHHAPQQPNKKLHHQTAITNESSDLEATMEVTGLLSDRLLPVNAEPVQVMMVMTSDDTKTNGMPPAKYSPRQGKKPNGRKAPDRKVPEEERVIGHRHVPTGRRKGSDTVIEGNMEAVTDGMGSDDRGSNTDSSNKERNVIGGSDREGNSSGTNENGDTNISSGNDGGSNLGSSGNDGGSNIGSSGNGADDSQHDSIATGNSEESNAGAGNNPENSDNGSDNEGGGTGTPPPGEGHETPDKRDKTGSDEEEHHREEQSRSRDEQRPQKEDKSRGREVPPHLHVKRHQYGDEEEEDPRPARVLNLRTKLVAKPQRKVRRRLGIKSSAKDGGGDGEREGEDKGEKRKEDEGSEEEESEQEALTVTLENLTLVEGGQIEATQLSIVPALDTPRAPHRLLTPTKYRPKRNNYEKATQTAVDTHLSKSRVNRRSLEERPKWGVNRPERCYLKASQRSLRCLAYLRKRAAPKDSREDSRSPSPLNQSKSSYSESSNRSVNRGTGMANNNKRTISQSSIGVCTPRIIQVLPPSGVASNLSAGQRCLSIRGNIGVMNGSRMTNRPQMVPIEKQHLQQSGFEHQQMTSVQEVLYQLTALKHGLQMKQQEWEVSRSQTPYSEISTK